MKRRVNSVLFLVVLLAVVVASEQPEQRLQRLKRRDLSSQQQSKDESGKMKKLYSNKEIVAFDDDDDVQSAAAAAPVDEMPSMSRAQRTDRYVRPPPAAAAAKQQPVSDELIDMLLDELTAPSRSRQKANNNKKTNNRPAAVFVDRDDDEWDELPSLDYYEEEDQDEDLVADAMRLNELGQSWPSTLLRGRPGLSNVDETGDMFVKKTADDEPDVILPVNKVDVKEKLLLEKEYNDQLKSRVQSSKPQDEKNFFNQELSMDLLKPSAAAVASNPPSMIKQQQTLNHEADPNLSSKIDSLKQQNDYLFMFVVAGCVLAGVVALIAAGVCWYTVHKSHKAAEAEYGVKIGKFNTKGSVKSTSSSSGDRRLAQSAQMYHYQHQKQQMIAMEKANNDTKPDNSDNSEGETEEGDYTVYECPGLAPTGEMEVKNPLFKEEFSQSLNNINIAAASSAAQSPPPPAYTTLAGASVAEPQLVNLDAQVQTPVAEQQPEQQAATTISDVNELNNNNNNGSSNNSNN